METLYTARLHGFLNLNRTAMEPALTEENVMSLLIVLGSSISLVGLVFAFITYSLFSDLRNLSGTTLMNLLAALFMTQLLYVIGVGGVPERELCLALAFALQYLKLSILCWMVVLTHHMYSHFKNYEQLLVSAEKSMGKTFLQYSLFAWGLPLVLLSTSAAIQYHDKGGKFFHIASLKKHNCWFLDTNAYIYGFLVPSGIFLGAIFANILRSAIVARYVISMQVDKRIREKLIRKRALQITLFTKITITVLIVTILGSLCKLKPSEGAWIAYHIAQGLQGIFITMLVTCNCQVLRLYTKKITSKNTKYRRTYGNLISGTKNMLTRSSITKSTSLQLLTRDPIPDPV